MSLSSPVAARSRRRLFSVATAFTVALAGLTALQAQPATAAPNPTVSITPNPATPNTVQNFAVSVTGGSSGQVGSFRIQIPASYTGIQYVSLTSPVAFDTPTYDSATRTFSASVTNNNAKLGDGQTAVFTYQAKAPATTGPTTIKVSAWSNAGFNGNQYNNDQTVDVGQLTQAITFAPLADKTYGDAAFTVSATGGGSGNPVTFTATGDCTSTGTNGTTITITGAGSCSVTANQAGGNGYSAAPAVTRQFTITKANQSITLSPVGTKTYGDADFGITASASSGLTVALAASGQCTLSGTTVHITGAGQCTITANQAGNSNYNAAAEQSVTFTINKAGATLALSDLGPFEYDGQPHAATATTTPAGLSGVTVTYDGSSTPPTNAGTYTVVAALTNDNYEATSVTDSLVITKKALTGSFTVDGKVYDGTTAAHIASCTIPSGIVGTEDVTLDCTGATASFDSADAGNRTATLSGAVLGGADKDNYTLAGTGTASAVIAKKVVTGEIQAADKTYDGTTSAVAVGKALVGKVGSDDVSVSVVSASFDTKNVGVDKTVTATIALVGTKAGNYKLSSTTATDQADIFAVALVGSFTADNKVYDGTTTATVHPNNPLSGVVGSEEVYLVVTGATFGDKNVADGKTVTGTLGLGGADVGNYVLSAASVNTATANITAKPVTVSFTANDKVWDGTTAATIATRTIVGKITGDDLTLDGGTATFDNANVGTGKTVTITGVSLGGADRTNYSLSGSSWTTTASITALYRGTGFYQPVDMTPAGGQRVYNTIKGGQTVPLKFDIYNASTGVEQTSLSIFGADATAQAAAFKVNKITCTATSTPDDAVELVTTGATSLRYDGTAPTGQFIQNWKTPTTVGSCYAVSVFTIDGSSVGPAYFKIMK